MESKLQNEDKEMEETQKKKQQDETAPVMEQNKELKERMKRELVEQRDQLKEQLQKVETEIVSGDKNIFDKPQELLKLENLLKTL